MPPKIYKTNEEKKAADAARKRLARSQESASQRDSRLKADLAYKRARIQNETDNEREMRLEAKQNKLAQETEEQRENRQHSLRSYDQRRYIAITHQRLTATETKIAAFKEQLLEIEENENTVEQHNCGEMKYLCDHCKSKNFLEEKTSGGYTRCCRNGKIVLPELKNYPELLELLMKNEHTESKVFKQNIRSINSSLAFASMGADIAPPSGYGPYCFRINGQIYHLTGDLHPNINKKRQYAQLYILDNDEATSERLNHPGNSLVPENLMMQLGNLISSINKLAEGYRMLYEVEQQTMLRVGKENMPNLAMAIVYDRKFDHRRYNIARANEVAIVFENSDGEPPMERDLIVYLKSQNGFQTKRINILDPNLDALVYPLFCPRGEQSWHIDLRQVNTLGNATNKRVSQKQYYCHLLSVRETFNPYLCGGKLTQQYFVDAYVRMESNRLNFIRYGQKQLRVENYSGLLDWVNNNNNGDPSELPGKMEILPSTFEGSPRNMQQRYQDAMAIVTKFGKPDLFVTVTCNPNWPEIKDNLDGQLAQDRPDIISRVFNLKLKCILSDIKEKQLFGKIKAMLYVIEFQKRGLPHAHILIILDQESKIKTEQDVDNIVCAELPNRESHPKLFDIVSTQMIHGPCGQANPKCVCMESGKCSKTYPKDFRETTSMNDDGYPKYRRRYKDTDNLVYIKNKLIDNRWVVPYNKYLLLKYNCHINVEVCASIVSVKYLFKYVYKGHDCANVEKPENCYDETTNFVNSRYVSPPEAAWRIFGFKMHDQSHSITRLPIHLPSEKSVYFDMNEITKAVKNAEIHKSKLEAYFELNANDPEARNLYYREIPEHYVWKADKRCWVKRQQGHEKVIGRMYVVNPKDTERYCLRLLLLHVKGATSFEDLKTVDNICFPSFREAAKQRGLLLDNEIWRETIEDAIVFAMPLQIRNLFTYICLFGEENFSMRDIWNDFKMEMCGDYCQKIHPGVAHSVTNPLHNCDKYALRDISDAFQAAGTNCYNFDLPLPPNNLPIFEEIYDFVTEQQMAEDMSASLNEKQLEAFNAIINSIENNETVSKCFFIDGPGGSGKTYLYKCLLHKIRGEGGVVLPTASTGIAANLLNGGRTFHSLFKLPIPLNETSISNIKTNSKDAKEIKSSKLIIIDECTMASNHALNTINRFLKELMSNNIPFGGKVVVLGGDFRQCLTIIPHAMRSAIITGCIKYSDTWNEFKKLPLNVNVRSIDPEYSEWLLMLGDGSLTNKYSMDPDLIEIPNEMICTNDIVTEIFGQNLTADSIKEMECKAILCPKNADVEKLNDKVMDILEGNYVTYFSEDSVKEDDKEDVGNYPIEFLNSVTPSGMPTHKLQLKVGTIIMLLRNLNTKKGLCNGTRLIVRSLQRNIIEAKVLTGSAEGDICLIPRIDLCPSSTNLPFKLNRRQFPVKPAFAMTINKSQGQTLDKVGIFLPEPVFGHGQLYVAFSRVRRKADVKVTIIDGPLQGKLVEGNNTTFTRNVVYKEVF